MKPWAAFAFLVACLSARATEPSQTEPARTEFEQSFVGGRFHRSARSLNGCEYDGGMSALEDVKGLRLTHFICDGRLLLVLNRQDDLEWQAKPEWFVVIDALLMPPMKDISYDWKLAGECEDTKKPYRKYPKNFFFVVAHLPKNKESVNWKTGVKGAWTINRETLRFEEYPIRHIVCYRQTPP